MAKRDHPKLSQLRGRASAPFEEAFPAIETARIEVVERGHSETGCTGQPRIYHDNARAEYVDCSHLDCYGGGVWVGKLLRDMVAKRETDREQELPCQGFEGTPGGRYRRSCIHRFNLKIHVDYKNAAQSL